MATTTVPAPTSRRPRWSIRILVVVLLFFAIILLVMAWLYFEARSALPLLAVANSMLAASLRVRAVDGQELSVNRCMLGAGPQQRRVSGVVDARNNSSQAWARPCCGSVREFFLARPAAYRQLAPHAAGAA